jgi:hypothetical protein
MQRLETLRRFTYMRIGLAALAACAIWSATGSPALAGFAVHGRALPRKATVAQPSLFETTHPWVEGDSPQLENLLFQATYPLLPTHNILKVYVYSSEGFTSAGIRFSARVPHSADDLSPSEIEQEAVNLIRTTFDTFPDIQQLDVWATVPVPTAKLTSVQNTMFSVSADRATYEAIRDRSGFSDAAFLAAFGRIWISPEVARE